MRLIWSSARKDLQRLRKDPLTIVLWIGIPLVIGLLITMATGGRGGPAPKAVLYVADHDDSFLSSGLTAVLGNMGGVVETAEVNEQEGKDSLNAGDGTGLLVIPEGFGKGLLEELPVELVLWTNPSQRILPGIIEEALSIFCEGSFYLHRLLGDELQEIVTGPAASEPVFANNDVARISVQINDTVRALQSYIDPPAIQLELIEEPQQETGGPRRSYGLLFLPGVLLMALFFTAQGLSDDLWRERSQGTLRRYLNTPQPVAMLFLGKLLAGMIIVAVIVGIGTGVGAWYFEISFTALPLAILWTVLTGGALLAGMFLLQTLAKTQRGGSILTNTIMFPLLMIGGSFFPLDAMPDWMAKVGAKTPNGWAVKQLEYVLLQEVTLSELLPKFAVLVVVAAGLCWLCMRRLRHGFAGN